MFRLKPIHLHYHNDGQIFEATEKRNYMKDGESPFDEILFKNYICKHENKGVLDIYDLETGFNVKFNLDKFKEVSKIDNTNIYRIEYLCFRSERGANIWRFNLSKSYYEFERSVGIPDNFSSKILKSKFEIQFFMTPLGAVAAC